MLKFDIAVYQFLRYNINREDFEATAPLHNVFNAEPRSASLSVLDGRTTDGRPYGIAVGFSS